MQKIHVFCDSAADIPQAEVEQYGIDIIPVTVTAGGRSFREYYDMKPERYWELLSESDEIPTTAQITPTQVLETYRRAKENGCTHVLGVIINAKGSGGFQSCCIARDMFYEEHGRDMVIELIDSETYTYIYGRVIVEACRMRDAGERFEDIVRLSRARLKRSEAVLGVYTLKHLRKSGRISGGAAFVGEALGLKPISLVAEGAVTVVDKARGEKNLVSRALAMVAGRAVHPKGQTAILLYGQIGSDKLDDIERRLRDELGFADVRRYPIGVSVITNTGPQAFAIAYYGAQRPVD